MMIKESEIEQKLIKKLLDLKYTHSTDIRDKAALEENFRRKFEALNRVKLTDAEFARLRDEIVTADVFTAAQALRKKGKFSREDGTPQAEAGGETSANGGVGALFAEAGGWARDFGVKCV
jgi:type I restriction enzyme, R subunit